MSLKRIQAQQAENLRLRQQLETAREALENVAGMILCGKKDQLPGRCDKAAVIIRKSLAAIGEAQPAKACAHFVRRIKMDGEKHLLVCADCGNVQEISQPTAQSEFGTQPASFDVAKSIHYPECWDTACYPTIADAIREIAAFRCTNDDCAQPASAEPQCYGKMICGREVFDTCPVSLACGKQFTNRHEAALAEPDSAEAKPIEWRCDDCRSVGALHCCDPEHCGGMKAYPTPPQQPRQESEIAAEALEEAAKICDSMPYRAAGARKAADAIRSLAAQKREAGK